MLNSSTMFVMSPRDFHNLRSVAVAWRMPYKKVQSLDSNRSPKAEVTIVV